MEESGSKRRRAEALASEKELSEVGAYFAEGQTFSGVHAEEQAHFEKAHRDGDRVTSSGSAKQCTVFLLDIFSGSRSGCIVHSAWWRCVGYGSHGGQKTDEGPHCKNRALQKGDTGPGHFLA